MLRAPAKEQRRLLELASFIEALPPEKFSMGQWGGKGEPRCICGWFMNNHALTHDDWRTAARMLGLDEKTACDLFAGTHQWSPQDAADEIRALAFAE